MRIAWLLLALSALLQKPAIEGDWMGTLDTPGGKLRVVVHVSRSSEGALAGMLDSPDQGAFGLHLQDVAFEGSEFRFALKVAGASFKGALNEAGAEIAGTFTQGGDMPLVLKKSDKPPEAPKRPQVPAKPYPYREEQVTFENKGVSIRLGGTLTLPPGKGPHPAAVLISGSGPQDRDESLMGHKPFLILADHLTRQGIAVLRYDDRGIGASGGKLGEGTSEDFATDTSSAVDYLKSRSEIDPKRIGLIGHSEGGIIAPMVEVRRQNADPGIAYLVLMAGTAVTGEEVLYAQGQAILKINGAGEEVRERQKAAQKAFFDVVRNVKDPAEAEAQMRKTIGESPQITQQIKTVNSPWFRFFLFYDPAPTLAKVKAPVLAINGELDSQVLPDQNLPVLEAALKKGGNEDYRIARLGGLNHLLQTAKTGGPGEYAQIEETMSPVALETISAWVRAHTGLK